MPWTKPDPTDPRPPNKPKYQRRRVPIPGPAGFTDADAQRLVEGANFAASVFAGLSEKEKETRQAYTYVEFDGWRLCVVGHIHVTWRGKLHKPGNSFIPGWQGWSLPTPLDQCKVIDALENGGTFPQDARYPTPA